MWVQVDVKAGLSCPLTKLLAPALARACTCAGARVEREDDPDIEGTEHVLFEGARDPEPGQMKFAMPVPAEGADSVLLGLIPPENGSHALKVTAKLTSDPTVEVERIIEVRVHANKRNVLPVGQTFVKASPSWTATWWHPTDVSIPGRGPAFRSCGPTGCRKLQ